MPSEKYDPKVDYFQKLQDAGIPISRTPNGFQLGTPQDEIDEPIGNFYDPETPAGQAGIIDA